MYVNSILIPATNRHGAEDEINEPFAEAQVLCVFRENSDASVSTQLLMLYYLLLYEDLRLHNMKPIMASKRVVLKYSRNAIAQIPIKYLLLKAQNEQANYGGACELCFGELVFVSLFFFFFSPFLGQTALVK